MSYRIYKLRFPNGIHIGGLTGIGLETTALSICSDTFYSALYSEYMRLYGDEEFYKISENGNFAISDLLPFKDTQLYIPKPYLSIKRERQNVNGTVDRKKVKALNYMPADKLKDYIDFLKTGENFPQIDEDFGERQLYTKNKVSQNGEDTQLYNIEVFKFNQNSGLYFIVNMQEQWIDKFENLLESLSVSGVGGKKSSGFGQFEMNDDPMELYEDDFEPIESQTDAFINKSLHLENKQYFLLSSYAPLKQEVENLKQENNYYNLIKRSGFVNLSSYSTQPQKRKQIYMISSGSILNFRPEGRIVDLNLHGGHSIYRMGKPIVMGVDLWEK